MEEPVAPARMPGWNGLTMNSILYWMPTRRENIHYNNNPISSFVLLLVIRLVAWLHTLSPDLFETISSHNTPYVPIKKKGIS